VPASRSRSRSKPESALILLVEDDPAQSTAVATALTARGHRVEAAATGMRALELAELIRPDIVILDLRLPDVDGGEICRKFLTVSNCSVIVVTGDALEARMVEILDRGADDYVLKPVSIDVLMARIRVAMRHLTATAALVEDQLLECGDLRLDVAAYQAIVDGEIVDVLPRQFDLLTALVRNVGKVMTYSALIRIVRGVDSPDDHLFPLRTSISKIRKSLGVGPERPVILTEHSIGYRLVAPGGG